MIFFCKNIKKKNETEYWARGKIQILEAKKNRFFLHALTRLLFSVQTLNFPKRYSKSLIQFN